MGSIMNGDLRHPLGPADDGPSEPESFEPFEARCPSCDREITMARLPEGGLIPLVKATGVYRILEGEARLPWIAFLDSDAAFKVFVSHFQVDCERERQTCRHRSA